MDAGSVVYQRHAEFAVAIEPHDHAQAAHLQQRQKSGNQQEAQGGKGCEGGRTAGAANHAKEQHTQERDMGPRGAWCEGVRHNTNRGCTHLTCQMPALRATGRRQWHGASAWATCRS